MFRPTKVVLFVSYCFNNFLNLTNFRLENCLTVMKDWTLENAFSQQSGGMRYRNGQLCVPTAGPYYIYAQLYFHTKGRVEIRKNNKRVTMLQPAEGTGYLPLYTGGVFLLRKGDVISLHSNHNVVIYMSSAHTYFGAFLI